MEWQPITSLEERLLRSSKTNPETGCIEWQLTKTRGYGRLTIGSRGKDRRTALAHRIAYEVFVGPIPDGLLVCHHCDNRCCINPKHLFVGTYQDNTDDREAKGRNKVPRKLSDDDVAAIHAAKWKISSKELGKMYGVSYHTIKCVWTGRHYPHLKPPPPAQQ